MRRDLVAVRKLQSQHHEPRLRWVTVEHSELRAWGERRRRRPVLHVRRGDGNRLRLVRGGALRDSDTSADEHAACREGEGLPVHRFLLPRAAKASSSAPIIPDQRSSFTESRLGSNYRSTSSQTTLARTLVVRRHLALPRACDTAGSCRARSAAAVVECDAGHHRRTAHRVALYSPAVVPPTNQTAGALSSSQGDARRAPEWRVGVDTGEGDSTASRRRVIVFEDRRAAEQRDAADEIRDGRARGPSQLISWFGKIAHSGGLARAMAERKR